jgi:D-lyxose ketol-isomerase
MKRSLINQAYRNALACFGRHHWALPPSPRWDITDFGLGDFGRFGLALVNLSTEREYCEKVMYARRGQATPGHAHARKKEDIICRAGELTLRAWPEKPTPGSHMPESFTMPVNGDSVGIRPGTPLVLAAGSRVTLAPGVWHTFWPSSSECIIGEVATANDDVGDNFFLDPGVGRFPEIDEDEPSAVRLVAD